MELLVKFFGVFIIQEFCNDNMEDFFELLLNIEIVKRKIFLVGDSIIKINILFLFCDIYKKIC